MATARKRYFRWLTVAAWVAIVFLAGYVVRLLAEEDSPHAQIRLDGYRFIHPLLECEMKESYARGHPDLDKMEGAVRRVVGRHLSAGAAETVAVYYRDLKSGVWFGIDEHEAFTPASLMKVPLMIGVLKRLEHEPSLLQRKIRYEGGDIHEFQHVRPEQVLTPGASYTVDDLIGRMIAYSDNDSALLLADHFGMASLEDTMAELGIPVEPGRSELMSLRSFSAFFRVLYNASYLSDHMSEQALGYLARSGFDRGIRAGIPADTAVAGKFGEYSAGAYQLHEFGIVYYPDHPYLLGVVTKGGTTESLPRVIQEISRAIYEDIHRQHGGA